MNFLGIGAQKAGTTWLHNRLKEVDGIWLPNIKEIHYFDRDDCYPSKSLLKDDSLISKIHNPYWREYLLTNVKKSLANIDIEYIKEITLYFFSRYNDQWYIQYMSRSNKICGEITPSYAMLKQKDVERIKSLFPDLKIIFMVRNPVERVWSSYCFSQRLSKSISIDKKRIKKFVNSEGQELRSDYLKTLETYLKFFEKNIIVGFYDAIESQPQVLIRNIIRFINGNEKNTAYCNFDRKSNTTINKVKIPDDIRTYLEEKYESQILGLNNLLGNYCKQWCKHKPEDESGLNDQLNPTVIL